MNASGPKSLPTMGFLTFVENPSMGLIGGYLVVNAVGRPLEFHCTTPVKPNRAQQILYGPTLATYLYGEQIGRTLTECAKIKANMVCTDHVDGLAVRDFVTVPVLLVRCREAGSDLPTKEAPTKVSELGHTQGVEFVWAGQPVAIHDRYCQDRDELDQKWQADDCQFDLEEPFGRIREAIEEATRSAAA